MNRTVKVLLTLLAIICILVAVSLAVAPGLIKNQIDKQARQLVASHNLQADWQNLSVSLPDSVTFFGLKASSSKLNSTLDAHSITVTIDKNDLNWDVVTGKKLPHIVKIAVDGAEVTLNVESFQKRFSSKNLKGYEDSSESRLIKLLLENPPEIQLNATEVIITRNEKIFLTATVEESQLQTIENGWKFMMVGTSFLHDKRLPEALRTTMSWESNGEIELNPKHLQVTIAGRKEQPLLSATASELVRAKVGSVAVDLNDFNFSDYKISARQLALSLGNIDDPALDISVDEFHYDFLKRNGEPYRLLQLKNPNVMAAPQDLAKLPKSLKDLKNFLAASAKSVDGEEFERPPNENKKEEIGNDRNAKFEKFRNYWNRLFAALYPYDIRIENLSLDLRIHRIVGVRQVTVAHGVNARAFHDSFSFKGQSASGEIEVHFVAFPGKTIPLYLFATAKDIELAKLPGMPQSRSKLPTRGTSGSLAGNFSSSINMYSGMRGFFLPDNRFYGDLSFNWNDGEVDLVGVSDEPIGGINLSADADFEANLTTGYAHFLSRKLQYGPITGHLDVRAWQLPFSPIVRASGSIDDIDCQRFFRNMPVALLGPYRYLEVEGHWSPGFKLRLPFAHPDRLTLEVNDFRNICHITHLNALPAAYPNVVFNTQARNLPLNIYRFPPVPKIYIMKKNIGKNGEDFSAEIKAQDIELSNDEVISKKFPPTYQGDTFPKPETVDVEKYRTEGGTLPTLHAPYDESFRDVTWLNKPFVKQVIEGATSNDVFVGPGTSDYVPIRELPSYVGGAAYLSEEMEFYFNRPIAIGLIEKAIGINLIRGRFIYGGSTVTQQLVKNLFLMREKTLTRKFQEALIAWRITEEVPRNRVLELYLNCIEFGPNIYGIGQAARFYFQKDARNLEPLEAIFLAMIKPTPLYGAEIMRRGKEPSFTYWNRRRELLFSRLHQYGYVSKRVSEEGPKQRLSWERGKYVPLSPIAAELPEGENSEVGEDESDVEAIENTGE